MSALHPAARRTRHVAARAALALVALVVVGAACGVPRDDQPRDLDASAVPFELLGPNPDSSPTTAAGPASRTVDVYLAGPERLVPVGRQLPAPVTAADAVAALLDGAGEADTRRGLRTAIPAATELLGTRLDGGVLTIDLSDDFLAVQGAEQRAAVAQLVYTATGIEGVDGVELAISGQTVQVPDDNGRLVAGPLNRSAFATLGPVRG